MPHTVTSDGDEFRIRDTDGLCWLQFGPPRTVLTASTHAGVMPVLREVERAVDRRGVWAAGWIAYEAAPAFDRALAVRSPAPGWPLAWFGLYDPPRRVPRAGPTADPAMPEWTPAIDAARYEAAIARIKDYIAAGDTYQVNFTLRLRAPFDGDPSGLFQALDAAQGGRYGAFWRQGGLAIASASPELFFSLDGARLVSRPMKGTARRGRWAADDAAAAATLRASEKERAENVMIVDMVRHDLGRVARTGSVRVERLFGLEPYPNVWQMTGTVAGETSAGIADILTALFPAASVTGAPKVRTMEIIAELEDSPRGVYSGAIGFVAPGRRAQFNVAIRTVAIDRTAHAAEYGVGGGIVWDSTAEDEYAECRAKASILAARRPHFELLETMRWTPGEGVFLLERHVGRLRESAAYFGWRVDESDVRAALDKTIPGLPSRPHRLRLRVGRDGTASVDAEPFAPFVRPPRLGLAREPVDPSDVFLYHKTTRREVYDAARRGRPDCDDVLLWNDRGEVTESCIANVEVEIDGRSFTPPLACGLLPGTLRAERLARGQTAERAVRRGDLHPSTRLRLVNSVRGVYEVEFVG